jgi:hypothetical protein
MKHDDPQAVTIKFLEDLGYFRSRNSLWPEYTKNNDDGTITRVQVDFTGRQVGVAILPATQGRRRVDDESHNLI